VAGTGPATSPTRHTPAAATPAHRPRAPRSNASRVRFNDWNPTIPPAAALARFASPAARSSWFRSASRRVSNSTPLAFRRIDNTEVARTEPTIPAIPGSTSHRTNRQPPLHNPAREDSPPAAAGSQPAARAPSIDIPDPARSR
jgi:hypothetical protein